MNREINRKPQLGGLGIVKLLALVIILAGAGWLSGVLLQRLVNAQAARYFGVDQDGGDVSEPKGRTPPAAMDLN